MTIPARWAEIMKARIIQDFFIRSKLPQDRPNRQHIG